MRITEYSLTTEEELERARLLLRAAEEGRSLISAAKRWTTYSAAKDSDDRPVSPTDDSAVKWCAIGSAAKGAQLVGSRSHRLAEQLISELDAVAMDAYGAGVVAVNDRVLKGGRAAVIKIYKQVIQKLRTRVEEYEEAHEVEDVAL